MIQGLYGAPNEEVARCASSAIRSFGKRYPKSSINYIHLVDISPDCVRAFQQELDNQVCTGHLQSNKEYADFDKWLGHAQCSENEPKSFNSVNQKMQ